jgi:hypothetical protein
MKILKKKDGRVDEAKADVRKKHTRSASSNEKVDDREARSAPGQVQPLTQK